MLSRVQERLPGVSHSLRRRHWGWTMIRGSYLWYPAYKRHYQARHIALDEVIYAEQWPVVPVFVIPSTGGSIPGASHSLRWRHLRWTVTRGFCPFPQTLYQVPWMDEIMGCEADHWTVTPGSCLCCLGHSNSCLLSCINSDQVISGWACEHDLVVPVPGTRDHAWCLRRPGDQTTIEFIYRNIKDSLRRGHFCRPPSFHVWSFENLSVTYAETLQR
jgi:hypothetical protein